MWLHDLGRIGGIVGRVATHAIRRELFIGSAAPTRDFASVMLAQHPGYKAVSAPASCVVRPATDLGSEQRRRSRTMTRMSTLLSIAPGCTTQSPRLRRQAVLPQDCAGAGALPVLLGVIAAIARSLAAHSDLAFIAYGACFGGDGVGRVHACAAGH
jgi:hypothetical protein